MDYPMPFSILLGICRGSKKELVQKTNMRLFCMRVCIALYTKYACIHKTWDWVLCAFCNFSLSVSPFVIHLAFKNIRIMFGYNLCTFLCVISFFFSFLFFQRSILSSATCPEQGRSLNDVCNQNNRQKSSQRQGRVTGKRDKSLEKVSSFCDDLYQKMNRFKRPANNTLLMFHLRVYHYNVRYFERQLWWFFWEMFFKYTTYDFLCAY